MEFARPLVVQLRKRLVVIRGDDRAGDSCCHLGDVRGREGRKHGRRAAQKAQGGTDATSTADGALKAMISAHVFSATPGSAVAPAQTTTTTTTAGATGEAS